MLLNNLGYHQAISEVFRRHLQNEYEIQLRCGKITEAGNEVIKALADDYKILQIEEEVEIFLNDETTKYLGSRHLIKLLEPVRIQIVELIKTEVLRVQTSCKKKQRKENNKLCREKCASGSTIHNFTECYVPDDLTNFLKNGLNNVPEIVYDKKVVISEIEDEVKKACSNLYTSLIGEYPKAISYKDPVDTFIRNLIVLAPSHKQLVSSS
jgi:hypothetical protein